MEKIECNSKENICPCPYPGVYPLRYSGGITPGSVGSIFYKNIDYTFYPEALRVWDFPLVIRVGSEQASSGIFSAFPTVSRNGVPTILTVNGDGYLTVNRNGNELSLGYTIDGGRLVWVKSSVSGGVVGRFQSNFPFNRLVTQRINWYHNNCSPGFYRTQIQFGWQQPDINQSIIRQTFGVASVNNLIYIFGGSRGTDDSGLSTLQLNPLTNQVKDSGEILPLVYFAFTSDSDIIYAFGGASTGNGGNPFAGNNIFYKYDTRNNTGWEAKTRNLVVQAPFASGARVGDFVYCIGGFNFSPIIQYYNTSTDEPWAQFNSVLPAQAASRYLHGSVAIDGTVYILGGRSSTTRSYLDTVYSFKPSPEGPLPADITLVEALKPLPKPLSSFGLAVVNKVIYIVGGQTTDGVQSANVYSYDTTLGTEGEWQQLSDFIASYATEENPKGVSSLESVGSFGRVYVFGGRDTARAKTTTNQNESVQFYNAP
jgi:hypothetical protein